MSPDSCWGTAAETSRSYESCPARLLHGHEWTLFFSLNCTDVNRDTEQDEHTLYVCLPLVAMPLSNTRPSRMHSGYFELCHKAAISQRGLRRANFSKGKSSILYCVQLYASCMKFFIALLIHMAQSTCQRKQRADRTSHFKRNCVL